MCAGRSRSKQPPRDRILLLLLYTAGLRVSEACDLRWREMRARGDAGQLTVCGKARSRVAPRGDVTRGVEHTRCRAVVRNQQATDIYYPDSPRQCSAGARKEQRHEDSE